MSPAPRSFPDGLVVDSLTLAVSGGRAQSEQNRNGAGPAPTRGWFHAGRIMSATGWQAHSVRGFISGVLGKHVGPTVESGKHEDGKRAYSIKG